MANAPAYKDRPDRASPTRVRKMLEELAAAGTIQIHGMRIERPGDLPLYRLNGNDSLNLKLDAVLAILCGQDLASSG